MSKMTNRLGTKDIVTKARKQYESDQFSKLPSVAVSLPSGGKTYPEGHPLREGFVEMRYPTAYHEDILTNTSYIKQGIVMDKLLESLCVTEININDLLVADKEKMILSARILAYGHEYTVQVTDPKTKKILQQTIDLNTLSSTPITINSDSNGEFEYKTDTSTLKFIFPTSGTLSNIREESTISDLLKNLICEVNGNREQLFIDDFIKYELLAKDAKQFRLYLEKHVPALEKTAEFTGEDGSTFTAGFQIGSDLFWS